MKNKRNIIIFIICYLAYTAIYIARLNLSMASPVLTDMGVLDKAGIGMLGSVFSVVYSVGRLVNGYIGDKKHPCFMMSAGLIIAGVSNIITGLLPPLGGMLVLWGANALAQSMLWSSLLRIISSIYDEQTAKKRVSFMVSSVAVGNILGILINTFIINSLGVRFAFIIPGGITLIICSLLIPATCRVKCENSDEHIPLAGMLGEKSIKTAIMPAFLHGVIKDNISLWMTVFFVDKYGIDLSLTAGFVLFIPVMGFIGRIIYPLCYKYCGENEHKVSVISFAVCGLLSLPLCINSVPIAIAAICLALIYAAVSLINTSMLSIFPMEFAARGNVASVSGIMDFATYFGAGVSSAVFGFLIKHTGYSAMYIIWAAVSFVSIAAVRRLIILRKENS